MAQSPGFPEWIPREDRPDPTLESIPEEIVEHALRVGTRYASCPDCGAEQWFPWTPEETTRTACDDCGAAVTVV